MGTTFYFYDTETSGINPRTQRIMQFAGVRTNMKFEPIGEPHNILIKLADDVLPEPDAVLVHGITPQKTIEEGITEEEFLSIFFDEIATEGTIFVGYNSVRFDDEFMRFTLWRNLYDPYEWQWKAGRSRWDLLDLARMTRALRPDGIQWPFAPDGKETNRLEFLTSVNGLTHQKAHDALSDVWACVDLAKLLATKQPKLFEYLLQMRDKKEVAKLVDSGEPFVYTSGRYSAEHKKTTIAVKIGNNSVSGGSLVYDVRHDPTQFLSLSATEIAERWKYTKRDDAPPRLPIKIIAYNKCPAIAPTSVLDLETKKRIGIDDQEINKNLLLIQKHKEEFYKTVLEAQNILSKDRQSEFEFGIKSADAMLYDGFIGDSDKNILIQLHEDISNISSYRDVLKDPRLKTLLPLFKARNFPKSLNDEEREAWELHRHTSLIDGGEKSAGARYFKRLSELSHDKTLTSAQQYIVEELNLYGQSILPLS